MQYGFSKPILVKVAPRISTFERVKPKKVKSLDTKFKSLSLSSLLHPFPTKFCIHPKSPAMANSTLKFDNYKIY